MKKASKYMRKFRDLSKPKTKPFTLQDQQSRTYIPNKLKIKMI
jgi:hypothetical protein